MQMRNHGGSCCGIRHLVGFGPWDDLVNARSVFNSRTHRYETKGESRLEAFNGFMKKLDSRTAGYQSNRGTRGKLVECVVTDGQIERTPTIPGMLKKAGFRLVSRFDNSSGDMCNVFHKTTGKCGTDEVPSWWTNAKEPEPGALRTYFRIPKGQPNAGQFASRPVQAAR